MKNKTTDIPLISIFLPSLRGGGAERIMVTLANAFAERGYKTDLVLAKAEGPYLKDVSERVNVVNLGASRVVKSLPALVFYLRRVRPDVMLAALNHANVIALLAKRMAGVKTRLVVSVHNPLSLSLAYTDLKRNRWMTNFMRWSFPWADGVISVSIGVADDLATTIGLPRDQVDVVYNPIDSATVLQQADQDFHHPWFDLNEPPVVLGMGRLTAQKDFVTLIRAFAQLRAHRPVRLVILGEGALRSDLQELIAELELNDDVAMPGFCENPFAWVRQSAVFVLSSVFEGFGNVLVEAMSCGTTVISTNCLSGPAEVLEGGKWGRLVPVGDVDAMAHAMAQTLDETDPPDVVKRAADFSVDRAVDGYLKLLFPS